MDIEASGFHSARHPHLTQQFIADVWVGIIPVPIAHWQTGETTMLEKFKSAGVKLWYCEYACYPQIPEVDDVLYVLRMLDTEAVKNVHHCAMGNFQDYLANVHMVAAAVVVDIAVCQDAESARQLIARAILALAPEEAIHRFDRAVTHAQSLLGQAV